VIERVSLAVRLKRVEVASCPPELARRWFGPVPATAPLRTEEDCAAEAGA
jgi:hypothetical protein